MGTGSCLQDWRVGIAYRVHWLVCGVGGCLWGGRGLKIAWCWEVGVVGKVQPRGGGQLLGSPSPGAALGRCAKVQL